MAGSSERAFSSASFFWATSQSKMPPQQTHGLLDFFRKRNDFSAHRKDPSIT
jgi:hypothetical protein